MMKKIIFALIAASFLIGVSAQAAATKIQKIKTWKIQIEVPKNWKIKKEGNDEYFKGKNVLRFEVSRAKLAKAHVNNWKKAKMSFLDGFAQDYANTLTQNNMNIAFWKVKNFKIPGYSAGRIIYTGTGEPGNLKIDQVLIVKGNNLYILTGYAVKNKFSKADKIFIQVFKSFKKY